MIRGEAGTAQYAAESKDASGCILMEIPAGPIFGGSTNFKSASGPQSARNTRILIYLYAIILLTARLAIAQAVVGPWDVQNIADPMDPGKTTLQAQASGRTHDGQQDGELKVIATCRMVSGINYDRQRRQVPYDIRSVKFLIVFLSDERHGVGFKRVGRGVPMRVKIDEDQPKSVSSFEDFRNYADVEFKALRGGTEGEGGDIRRDSPDEVGKLIHASRLLVELTTENDVRHILEIHPQDPSFQQFVTTCGLDRPVLPIQLPGQRSGPTQARPPGPLAGATAGMAIRRTILGPPEKIAARTYRGTLDSFVAVLPEYLQKAAAGIGAPQRNYDYEVRYIGQAARQCASITADQAGGIARLGPDYRPCAAPYGVPVPRQDGPPDPSHPSELLVEIRPQNSWGDGGGISVVVAFEVSRVRDRAHGKAVRWIWTAEL